MADLQAAAGAVLGALDAADEAWLDRLARVLDATEHALGGEPPPGGVIRRDATGGWRAGPVLGELWLDGRSLRIVAPERPEVRACEVVGELWCRGVESATRHGPPAFRRDVPHVGASLRGRLDVRGSVRLRASGSSDIASVFRARDLRNEISRALVAADRALTRQIGHDRWRSRRVREVMPQVHVAVGPRSGLPSLAELRRIRYTPITRPFRDIGELSVRIVRQDPIVTTAEPGRAQGIFVPVALVGLVPPEAVPAT